MVLWLTNPKSFFLALKSLPDRSFSTTSDQLFHLSFTMFDYFFFKWLCSITSQEFRAFLGLFCSLTPKVNLVTLIFFRESFKHTSSANIEIFWKTVLRYIFCKLQKSHSPKLPKYYPETFYGFYFVFPLINILIFFYPNKEGIVEFVFAQLNVWVISRICAGFTCKWDLDFMVELCTSAAHSVDRMQMQS